MNHPHDLILPHGGYRKLRAFAVALAAYDGTVIFCNRFVEKRSRTHDQMVQAARSGVQNIAEGSLASATSKKTELKLINVARASLGELIRDYEDYLRQNRLALWDKDSPRVRAMRDRLAGKRGKTGMGVGLSDRSDRSDWSDKSDRSDVFDEPLRAALAALETASPEVGANILLCLVHQASYLLGRLLQRLERDFIEQGGFTERLYHYRKGSQLRKPEIEYQTGAGQSDRSDLSDQSDF